MRSGNFGQYDQSLRRTRNDSDLFYALRKPRRLFRFYSQLSIGGAVESAIQNMALLLAQKDTSGLRMLKYPQPILFYAVCTCFACHA